MSVELAWVGTHAVSLRRRGYCGCALVSDPPTQPRLSLVTTCSKISI